jgi:hypothetical protein
MRCGVHVLSGIVGCLPLLQSIAFQNVTEHTTTTTYAAFPLFLAGNDTVTRGVGLAWVANMLQAPKGRFVPPALAGSRAAHRNVLLC